MQALERLNHRLKVAKIGVAVEQHKNRLYLRATLPPKPNDLNKGLHQQRIALGVYANSEGLSFAEAKAKEIGGLLAQDKFDWTLYFRDKKAVTIGDWLAYLEESYFSDRERTDTTKETWRYEYLQCLLKLPLEQQLSEEILKKSIFQNTKPNTRSRRRYVLAYAKLADLAKLTHNLRQLIGDYSLKAVSPRSIPSDEVISALYYKIDERSWQWIYGVMATYGLRNHEVFFLDFEDYPIAWINRGKTSERYVWPLFPEWAENWELEKVCLPDCLAKTNSGYGNRVTKAFKRLSIPFSPYNLRHAWARRSFEFGMDISLASAQLGHRVDVHCRVYRHWIDRFTYQKSLRTFDCPSRSTDATHLR